MHKRFFVMLAACFFLMPVFEAHGDVIFEPDNSFYKRHADQIVYLGRSFMANGEVGSVGVKQTPGGNFNIHTIQNGERTYVYYSCLYDGEYWGFTSEHSGWVKLSQMLVLYDYIAFAEDHGDEIYIYEGDFAQIQKNRSAIAWPWPGADNYIYTLEDLDSKKLQGLYAYTDQEGRQWGFVRYLYGSRNIWICLSDPLNGDLPPLNPAPEPIPWVSETQHVDIKQYTSAKDFPELAVVVILVILVVAGTAVLIRVFWKPNKSK